MHILNKNASIGFFDSGVGGLTVLKELKKILPDENYIFIGDTKHVPYGDKTKQELLSYSETILNYFEQRKVKAVVMACNTTSSVIYEDIKDKYPFKLYPLVQSCAEIFSALNVKKLGVFGTKATIKSGAYEKEIQKYNKNIEVIGQYCPDWVKIVENNSVDIDNNIKIIKSDLEKMLKNKPDKIILGCTHYPYLLKVLEKFAPKEMFIDPSPVFARFIKEDLQSNNLLSENKEGAEEIFVTSSPDNFKQASAMFYKTDKTPQLLN